MKNQYAIEAPFYDTVFDRTDDIPFYLQYAAKADGPLLECACGTGRLLLPLARAGYDVTGVDSSNEMLQVLRKKLRKENTATRKRVHLVQGDMRRFQVPKRFGMALIGFNSFLHNLTIRDEKECAKRVAEHLQPGGRFIIDIFNPDLARPQQIARLDKMKPFGKQTLLRFSSQDMNFKHQTMNCRDVYDFVNASGIIKRKLVEYQLRYIFKDELMALLKRCGFQIEAVLGSVGGEPFEDKSDLIVCVATKGLP
ncbi:MAG TPA: class I SAM-dependent methyltransferase [Terriglobales bacterium]|nr:class I SAM-dependent methyltransferase [Terriglobales bacterium]